MTEFKREPRYIVLKVKDLENYCNTEAMVALRRIGERIAEGRRDHGKPPFNAVVVEQDWPEFEPTWEAIEGRMTGRPIEPRYAIALRVKALEAENAILKDAKTPRTLDEWHEDFGSVLWWILPVVEPPFSGTPNDSDWPGYHTHWTPIVIPDHDRSR